VTSEKKAIEQSNISSLGDGATKGSYNFNALHIHPHNFGKPI